MLETIPAYVFVMLALVGGVGFLFLPPRVKVLVSFLVLSSLFDLVPTVVGGYVVRDLGIILLLPTYLQLLMRRRVARVPSLFFVRAIHFMVAWAILCVAYGVTVDGYPLLLTLKAARHFILGYFAFYVFIRLYETDPGAFQFLIRWMYRITYVLMPLVLIQYVTGNRLFFGLIQEYNGVLRALPIFLPICILFLWHCLARLLGGQRLAWHEAVYVGLTVAVTALTYTRGIYLASLAVLLVMLFILGRSGRLVINRVLGYFAATTVCLVVLIGSGAMDRIVNRFLSGVSVISGDSQTVSTGFEHDVDTFTGRMLLAGERIGLVIEKNPLVGYAFIHEMLVPNSLRSNLKYAAPVDTPELQKLYAIGQPYIMSLHSVDIGWASVVVDMGLVGFAALIAVMGGVLFQQFRVARYRRMAPDDYYWSTGLFLQLLMLALLMFNGNPYVDNVHIVCFLLASFALCSGGVRVEQRRGLLVYRAARA